MRWTAYTNTGETYTDTGYDKAKRNSVLTITKDQLKKLLAVKATHSFKCEIKFGPYNWVRSSTVRIKILEPGKFMVRTRFVFFIMIAIMLNRGCYLHSI